MSLLAANLVRRHEIEDSASYDEPIHILAGYQQVFQHNGLANIEHPPLAKEVAGLGLLGYRRGLTPARLVLGNNFFLESRILSHEFLFRNAVPADEILSATRGPMLLFFVALQLLVFGAARRFFGTAAGFFALAMVAFEPNFLAHAGIVHNDVAIALFWLAGTLAWGRVLEKRSFPRLLTAGLVLGLALATKFSAVYLPPTFLLLAVARRLSDQRREPAEGRLFRLGRALGEDALALTVVLLAGLGVLMLLYWPAVSSVPVSAQQFVINARVGAGGPGSSLAAQIAGISPWSRPLAQFLGGLACVWKTNTSGLSLTYLNGHVTSGRFFSYFLVAFLVKSTLPFLLAVFVGGYLAFKRGGDFRDLLVGIPVAYYFVLTLSSSYGLGIRHLLPVYPLLAIAASRLASFASSPAELPESRKGILIARAFAVLLCLGQVGIALRTAPFYLSYFNALGGGSEGGARILSDSNVDWGLDLRRLAADLRRRGVSDPTVAYFGGDDVLYRLGVPDFITAPVARGRVVAISAVLMAEGPQFYSLFGRNDIAVPLARLILDLEERGRLIGRIGGSTCIFELPPPGALPARR